MAWLTEPVAELTYQGDRRTTQALIRGTLQRLGVPAEELPEQSGLLAQCLTPCANLGFWRCWSDALEFRLEDMAPHGTRVTITAVPNLFRLRVTPGERVTDMSGLLTALQATLAGLA